ncbi:hypothetical protein HAX54_002771 [Datura stramonium]|uniref:Uncharacterized protein n=1 Tax=Datura stramonium TaxID=4076 RepID=A0ABS8WRJ2_DATST|nr:hypothetical protein [Datura stramonium]
MALAERTPFQATILRSAKGTKSLEHSDFDIEPAIGITSLGSEPQSMKVNQTLYGELVPVSNPFLGRDKKSERFPLEDPSKPPDGDAINDPTSPLSLEGGRLPRGGTSGIVDGDKGFYPGEGMAGWVE